MLPLLAAPALATSTFVGQTVAWPPRDAHVPRDVVLHVLDHVASQPEPALTDEADQPVAFTSHAWRDVEGRDWRMIVPDDELPPGAYHLQAANDSVPFVVDDRLAEPVDPPSPYRRWRGSDCETGELLEYRVCGGGVVHLVATGDPLPPDPTVAAPATSVVGSVGEDTIRRLADDGWPSKVWIGDLDESGRFSGWWPADEVGPPAEGGVIVAEAPGGSAPSTGATLTSVASCPAPGPWEVFEEYECGTTDLVTQSECGCRSAGSAGPGVLVTLLAITARAGRSRSSARRPGPARR